VNPAHLEAVTHRENMLRSAAMTTRKPRCPRGHPYDEANTYWWRGVRHCRLCREAVSRSRVRRRAMKAVA
jgi:hypothetical protein